MLSESAGQGNPAADDDANFRPTMIQPLHQHLFDLNVDMKKRLLQQMGAWDKTITRKAEFVAAIETQLRDNLAGYVARLSEPERLLLAESAHRGELIGPREFTAKFGGACPLPKPYYNWNEPVSLLEALIARPRRGWEWEPGLVSEVIKPLQALLSRPEARPPQIAARLPERWQPKRTGYRTPGPRPLQVHEGERIAPVELVRVLRLIQAGKVRVTESSRRPTEEATRLIGATLVVPDFALEAPAEETNQWTERSGPVRAHAWGALVQQCGWAKPRGGLLQLTAEGKTLVGGFSPVALREGVTRFAGDDDFDELHRIDHIRGQSGKGKRHITSPGVRRAALLEAVEVLPAGGWLALAEAQRLMAAEGGDWRVLNEPAGVLYFAELRYGVINDEEGLDTQWMRAVFFESLATLGLLDVAYVHPHSLWPELSDSWGIDEMSFCGRYDGLAYVRLNALGAYALGLADSYEPVGQAAPGPKPLRVLPNLEIEGADSLLNPADRACLEMMGTRQPNGHWDIDTEQILAHVESGGSLAELQEFLAANVEGGIPEAVREFFDAMGKRFGAFRRSRPAVLLEWASEEVARYIAGASETSALCSHAGGSRLVVQQDQLATFRRGLRKLGFVLPAGK